MPTIEELKKYLRIDGGEDDSILTLLLDAAKEYLDAAGIPATTTGARYKLAIMLYCSVHYDNRNPADKIEKFNFALESIIMQLKN